MTPGSRFRGRSRLLVPLVAATAIWLQPAVADGRLEVGLLELPNYYEYSAELLSSGQPTREQFRNIAEAGIDVVVNLAPVDSPGAFPDEGELAASLGLDYAHIPVDWEEPPPADFRQFVEVMKAHADKRVLVHCYANARASAFVYLYQVLHLGHEDAAARPVLEEIWANNEGYELPNVPHWQAFIATVLSSARE